MDIDQNILDLFWNLCENDTKVRLNACTDILRTLRKKQQEVGNENVLSKDLEYSVERLIKGLASPRDAARLGYTLLLTEILKKFDAVQIEEVLELMKKHLIISDKQDKRNPIFGQLFAYTALVRSGRLPNHTYLSYIILSLYELCHGKTYILNAVYKVFIEIFSQLSKENFKQDVWPHLKKKLPDDWSNCSSESLWLLLLCIRMFPDSVSAAYLRNHWESEDIFASDNLEHLKRHVKQTTSSLPMLHPLCSELVALAKERKDFNEIWNAVVDDNLYIFDQKEKNFVGYEMLKFAIKDSPTKKIIKTVLSPKFCAMFIKSFLGNKNPMNPAACQLADFFANLVKASTSPDMQIMVLKIFLQIPEPVMFDQILKKKEVLQLIQNLLPDAVKTFSEILKSMLLKKSDSDDRETNNMKQHAVHQIANLVCHPAMLTNIEWRLDIIKFLFLHSFFTIKETTSEILHCEKCCDPLPDSLKGACFNSFLKAINFLHMKTEKQQSSLNNLLRHLKILTEYADQLMSATENVALPFPVKKIEASWKHIKTIAHKLKKRGVEKNESNAFQALFLHLGFLLFKDPEDTSQVLEELYNICCEKALQERKQEMETSEEGEEPHWTVLVIEIFLSLLSKPSKNIRKLVMLVFPLFCPFIEESSLQHILDVFDPQQGDDMLVDESDVEEDNDNEAVEFDSGSSSSSDGDESDKEQDSEPVDEEFRKKIQAALGPAADDSDAESVVLTDSEMFKLDETLSEVFKNRMKTGHTKLTDKAEALLNLKLKCLDLIMLYLKSEPPMRMVLMCIEPIIAAFEYGHQNKNRKSLLQKAVSTLELMTKIRKFQHHNDVRKSELKRLLELLIPKCHKEVNMTNAMKLYSVCLFIVLCSRKVKGDSEKESTKTPFYIKLYLSALDQFATGGSSNMLPQFFTNLMMACPELSCYFLEPCISYAFNSKIRLFKRTQCLGLLSEGLRFSKGQKDITNEQWLKFGNSILPPAIECLKAALESSIIKPAFFMELLNVVFTSHLIVKEKTGQCLLKEYADALPLEIWNNKNLKKLNKKGKLLKNKIIICLGGDINELKASGTENQGGVAGSKKNKKKRKLMEDSENNETVIKEAIVNQLKKKMKPEDQSTLLEDSAVIDISDGDLENSKNETKPQKNKLKKKKKFEKSNIVDISDSHLQESNNELLEKPKKKKLKNKNVIDLEKSSINSDNEDHSIVSQSGLSDEPKKKKSKTKKCKKSKERT